jgi:hypothetical protein
MSKNTIKRDVFKKKYFKIHREDIEGRKTPIYHIETIDGTIYLGRIKWFPAWRKYCFFPEEDTIWDVKCLEEINKAIELAKKGKI